MTLHPFIAHTLVNNERNYRYKEITMFILMALTLIFGKEILPVWLQDKVTQLEGTLRSITEPVRGAFGGTV